MAKATLSRTPLFERLPLEELHQGRRGKHHDLLSRIASEIDILPDGEALKIPLASVDIPLANLRSAVSRKMQARGIRVASFSDRQHLFLWRKTPATSQYERKSRRRKSSAVK